MPEGGKTIYKICRKQAGYTQENAAELLGCSVRALARYESGETPVPDDIVRRMDQLYSNHFLAYSHFRQSSRLAEKLLPAVSDCGLQTAALRFYNQLEDLEPLAGRKLLHIAEDGVIDAWERPVVDNEILPMLEDLAAALAEIILAVKSHHPDT